MYNLAAVDESGEADDGLALWAGRIRDARKRREEYEPLWEEYARLHTNAYIAAREANDDPAVVLPNGDQVKLGAIHANIEQTLAQLEVPEPVVTAAAKDMTRSMGLEDTHREALLGQALSQSIELSGLVTGRSVLDLVKLAAVITGHGVVFSGWEQVSEERVLGYLPALVAREDGLLDASLDADGVPAMAPVTEQAVVWEGVRDRAVSPMAFLLDAGASQVCEALWMGHESIVPLEVVRADPRLAPALPEGLRGGTYRRKDIYGEEGDAHAVDDAVCLVTVWEPGTRTLRVFLEHYERPSLIVLSDPRKQERAGSESNFLLLDEQPLPLRWDHPDDAPYNVLVPIPALDHPFGISQVEHTKTIALEMDKSRTRWHNRKRQDKRIFVYNKNGGVDDTQLQAARTAQDMAFVGIDVANDDPDALKRALMELPSSAGDDEFYKVAELAGRDIDRISGVSAVPAGGAETATESANIMAIGGARTERKRRLVIDFLVRVARVHKALLAAFAPEGQQLLVRDPDGMPILLQYGRAAFQGRFDLRVAPGGENFNVSPTEQKMLVEMTPFVTQAAQMIQDPLLIKRWLRYLMTKAGVRQVDQMLGMGPQPMAGMGGGMLPPAPGGIDGNLRPDFVPGDLGTGQALRAGVNMAMEMPR